MLVSDIKYDRRFTDIYMSSIGSTCGRLVQKTQIWPVYGKSWVEYNAKTQSYTRTELLQAAT